MFRWCHVVLLQAQSLPLPRQRTNVVTAIARAAALDVLVALALLGALSLPAKGAQGCGGEAPLVAHGDVERAALSYAGLEGITHVEPNFALGDGSDIEAAWVDGAWYLMFREAWGDCPSGCLYSALHYFIEREGEVERVARERAANIATFARLVGDRRWNHRPESP